MTLISSEVGRLRRLFIHGLDESIEKMIPLKAQECLFEDIIDVDIARNREYSLFTRILLYFLDEQQAESLENSTIDYANPFADNYFRSDRLIDIAWLLRDVLSNRENRVSLLNWVLASEGLSQNFLQEFLNDYTDMELARTLISGCSREGEILFRPLPNLIMVRDIAVFINDHILICQPAKLARKRETVIFYFLVNHHRFFENQRDKVIWTEQVNSFLSEGTAGDQQQFISMEGGDFLMVAENHLLIGVSERTTLAAAQAVMSELFERNVVQKVTLVFLPKSRYCMHLDTILTQAKKGLWIVFGPIANHTPSNIEKNGGNRRTRTLSAHYPQVYTTLSIRAEQHFKDKQTGEIKTREFDSITSLLESVSREDLRSPEFDLVYCADDNFPDNWREQWTDGCNSFAVKEGVIFLYDRNRKTIEAFRRRGFAVRDASDLLADFKMGEKADSVENTVIVLPSSELSRARGGPHCMTLPIERSAL